MATSHTHDLNATIRMECPMDNVIARNTSVRSLVNTKQPRALSFGIYQLNHYGIDGVLANKVKNTSHAENLRQHQEATSFSVNDILLFGLNVFKAANVTQEELETLYLDMFLKLDDMLMTEWIRNIKVILLGEKDGTRTLRFRVSLGNTSQNVSKARRDILMASYRVDGTLDKSFYDISARKAIELLATTGFTDHHYVMRDVSDDLGNEDKRVVSMEEFSTILNEAFLETGHMKLGHTLVTLKDDNDSLHCWSRQIINPHETQ